jgi:hypothetical protein
MTARCVTGEGRVRSQMFAYFLRIIFQTDPQAPLFL